MPAASDPCAGIVEQAIIMQILSTCLTPFFIRPTLAFVRAFVEVCARPYKNPDRPKPRYSANRKLSLRTSRPKTQSDPCIQAVSCGESAVVSGPTLASGRAPHGSPGGALP